MTDEEKSIDVAGRQERVAQLLNGPQVAPSAEEIRIDELIQMGMSRKMAVAVIRNESKPARRPRSDKGTVKGPKAKQLAGALTKEQVETIYKLIAEHSSTKEDALLASTKALDAANRLELYLDSLKARQ